MLTPENRYVIYGANGLCRVEGQKDLQFGQERREYLVLTPLSSKGSTVYVPVDKAALMKKIKPVLSEEEIGALLRCLPQERLAWNEDASLRKEQFREILDKGDRKELLKLIRALYEKRQEREAEGKKLWAFEEHTLDSARNLLYEEFAFVLKIPKDEVENWIASQEQ